MASIKLVSGKTIIKKITVGVPIRAVKSFNVETTVAQLNDVVSAGGVFSDGYVLVYNATAKQWQAKNILERQRIDGGSSFAIDSFPGSILPLPYQVVATSWGLNAVVNTDKKIGY